MKFILSKKASWFLLICFFIFDNIVSYFAVTRMHGREANLAIAFIVEKYPLLYFLCIPGEIIIMYFIILGLNKLANKLFKKSNINQKIMEKIILGSIVIYWIIGNSFMNLMFILGHRLSIPMWYFMSIIGILLAVGYFLAKTRKNIPKTVSKKPKETFL